MNGIRLLHGTVMTTTVTSFRHGIINSGFKRESVVAVSKLASSFRWNAHRKQIDRCHNNHTVPTTSRLSTNNRYYHCWNSINIIERPQQQQLIRYISATVGSCVQFSTFAINNNNKNHRRSEMIIPRIQTVRIMSTNKWNTTNKHLFSSRQQQQQRPLVFETTVGNKRAFHTTPTPRASEAAAAAAVVAAPPIPSSVSSKDEMPPIRWTTHRLSSEQIQKVDAIFHKILWLDLFEASMLNDIVNQRMDITMNSRQRKQLTQLMDQRAEEAVGNMSSNTSTSGDAAEEVEVGPVLVDLKLVRYEAASKIKVIKEVRSILNLGLKEAKEMVESAPVTLQKNMKPELADELKIKLESVGASIEIAQKTN